MGKKTSSKSEGQGQGELKFSSDLLSWSIFGNGLKTKGFVTIPIGSMYGIYIYPYIFHISEPKVG